MEILDITMKHFGKFTDQTMAFHPGVNIIYGDNETGKSTISSFIRGMFFGIDKMRGRASETDEYNLRAPWENSSYFAGSLRFRSGGRVYRIERNFDKKAKSARLVCETDGWEQPMQEDDICPFLDGMGETAFSNTVFFGQTRGQTGEGLASAVRNGMLNAELAGGGQVDAAKAMDKLKEEKKRLEREKKQKMADKISGMQELSMKIDYTRQEMEELASAEQKYRESLKLLGDQEDPAQELRQRVDELYSERRDGMNAWKIGKILMALAAAGALAAGLALTAWEVRAGAAAVILAACLGVHFFSVRDEAQKKNLREREMDLREQRLREEYARQREIIERQRASAPQRQRLLMNLEWTENARKEKRALLEDLQEEYESLRRSEDGIQELETDLSAVYLAMDTLQEVTAQVYQEHARKLNDRVSGIVAEITGGKYTGVFLDENFQVRIHTPQKLLSIWQVSRGTMEQIYFAVRLACAEFLNPGEPAPLILDDAFLTYDDTRLAQTLGWLRRSGRQALLFTCHRREQEIMLKISGSPLRENG